MFLWQIVMDLVFYAYVMLCIWLSIMTPVSCPVMLPNQQLRHEGNNADGKITHWTHIFFIDHQTPDGTGVIAFMPALWRQYQYKKILRQYFRNVYLL